MEKISPVDTLETQVSGSSPEVGANHESPGLVLTHEGDTALSHRALDLLDSLVLVVDQDFRCVRANHAFLSLVGCDRESVILGLRMEEFLAPDMAEELRAHLQSGRESRTLNTTHAAGHFRWKVACLRAESGNSVSYILNGVDLTSEWRIREQLRKANLELEKASQMKSEFVAMMSHEVRTPINVILNSLKLLENTGLTDEQSEILELATAGSRSLGQLVSQVLDLSRLESANWSLESSTFELRPALESLLRTAQSRLGSDGLEFHLMISEECEGCFTGPWERLRQVLSILLDNSVKFTPEGGSVTLSAAAAGERSGLRFSVIDTGIGIPRAQLARVFEPFHQVSGASRHEGSGLGLAIAQKLMNRMGGTIEVESVVDVGTIFTLECPLSRGAPSVFTETIEFALPDRLNCLVVEDNPLNLRIFIRILEGLGCRVVGAGTAEQALEITEAEEEPFQLVLTDVQLPGMTGLELARELRRRPSYRQVILVGTTARALQGDRDHCLEAGMDAYLPKPFYAEELVRVVGPLLGSR